MMWYSGIYEKARLIMANLVTVPIADLETVVFFRYH